MGFNTTREWDITLPETSKPSERVFSPMIQERHETHAFRTKTKIIKNNRQLKLLNRQTRKLIDPLLANGIDSQLDMLLTKIADISEKKQKKNNKDYE